MAKQFDPRRVLKQISNDLLNQFFAARNELRDVPWKALKETEVQPIFDAWQLLEESKRREVQVIFQDINDLADDCGLAALAEGVNLWCPDRMEAFAAIESRIDKAMWVYLNVPSAFEQSARFARADALSSGRYWFKSNGLPKIPLHVTDDMKRDLEKALVAYYPKAQGRGYYCAVEHYRRSNGNEYFFAYLDNYPDSRLVFDNAGTMHKQRERGAFDNVFVYCPDDGTMEMYVQGGRKVREPLQALFCEAALGPDVEPAQLLGPAYELEGLKDPAFAFPTDPADGVAEVRVRRLCLGVSGIPGRRVTFEVGPKDHQHAIYQAMSEYLNTKNLPMSSVWVTQATFLLVFHSVGNAKARRLTFSVSHPSSSDLKSHSEELRAVGERCLKLWGIIAAQVPTAERPIIFVGSVVPTASLWPAIPPVVIPLASVLSIENEDLILDRPLLAQMVASVDESATYIGQLAETDLKRRINQHAEKRLADGGETDLIAAFVSAGMSSRKIETEMKKRGFLIDHSTISRKIESVVKARPKRSSSSIVNSLSSQPRDTRGRPMRDAQPEEE